MQDGIHDMSHNVTVGLGQETQQFLKESSKTSLQLYQHTDQRHDCLTLE